MKKGTVVPLLFVCISCWLAACSSNPPLQPTVDFKSDYGFEKVESFSLLSRRSGAATSAVISDMEMRRVDSAFKLALENRGLRFEDKAVDADLLVSWLLVAEEKTDVRAYNSAAYYQCWGCGPAVSDVSVRQFTQGTLVVDLIDPHLNQSVWRSVVQSKLDGRAQGEGQQEIFNQVAEKMLEGFPP
jgi:hypothetical protein